MSFKNCTHVTTSCPVQATTYGYVPNHAANMALLVIFGVCAALQLGFGVFYRTWTFMVALAFGCIMELVGYLGRLQMHDNVWNQQAFRQQIVCLILAPSLIAAGIYLALKHIILYLGPEHSRLKPKLYTWVFIGCDIFSFVVQAAGGGLAAAAKDDNKTLRDAGNDMMIAGVAIQVVTMCICGLLALDFAVRYWRRGRLDVGDDSIAARKKTAPSYPKFQLFCLAEIFAFTTVLVRCIYRLPEMAGGWGGALMRSEPEFLTLDGMMVALASVVLTIFHPGFCFPPMAGRSNKLKMSPRGHELLPVT